MLARCVATLKPPPELTLSQWADRYRMLSAESSAEPGRWHTDKAPYQREIMDAIGDAHIRRVVIMCAAQLGKTELLLNILGYFMAYAPAPILVMQPTLDMGQTFSKDRLAPMIRDTPVLRGLVDVKSRYAGNTILKKNFPGGHITIVGANSATGLASRPIKVLLADEVDRYPGSAGTEGDPLSLAQKRQTTFWDKKTVMVSTPVIKGHSRIETEYNQSTREEWNVPCPECGHYQPFVWANLIFDPDDLQKEIVYKCERCGCVANEYRWKQQSQQGRFVAEKEYGTSRKGQAYSRYDENTGVYTQYVDKRTGRTCNGEIFDEAKGPVSVIAGGQLQLKSSGASASIQAKTGMGIVAGTTVAIEAGTFMSLEATGAMSISAGGDFKFNIGGDSEEKRKGTTKQEYLDNVEQEVTGDVKQTLTGNLEQTVTGDVLQTITGTVTRNVTGDVTLNINGASITISAGGDISITSPTKVEVSAPILNAEGASGDVKVQSISLVQHKHTSAAPGSESSQPLP